MPNREKVSVSGASNASRATSAVRKSAIPLSIRRQIGRLETSLQAEREAKNAAYAFILAHDYLPAFASFRRKMQGMEPHALCRSLLLAKSLTL